MLYSSNSAGPERLRSQNFRLRAVRMALAVGVSVAVPARALPAWTPLVRAILWSGRQSDGGDSGNCFGLRACRPVQRAGCSAYPHVDDLPPGRFPSWLGCVTQTGFAAN